MPRLRRSIEIAIVGRPNVGKSTLFNRLIGRRLALVDATPGVTRDRRVGQAKLGDLAFTIVDTAGFEEADDETLAGRMRAQTLAAVESADLVLFVIDARTGVTALDTEFAGLLRRAGKPVILLANKAEGASAAAGVLEGFSLGFGDPVAISAEHGEGLADLHNAIDTFIRQDEGEADEEAPETGGEGHALRVAIVGRPNVGKSTLINRILGEDRLLTGPEAGITRDSIAIDLDWNGRAVRLFDTAGIRRKARVEGKLEKLSVADALRAIRFAEVVVIVLDATHPFEKQDLQIADLVEREGRAAVIALSKWDLVDDRRAERARLEEMVERLLPQLSGIAMVPVSGLTGEGLPRLRKAIEEADRVWNERVSTGALNRWLGRATGAHPPPLVSGRRVQVRYMTQSKARPPTFVAFVSRPEALPDSYQRYLLNGIRETFRLKGTPLRLTMRKGENPYAGRAKKKG